MSDPMRFDHDQFHQGDDVLGLNGDKIGSVSDIGPNYLKVSTGFLGLGEHLYIPFDAVTRVQGHDIYLDVTKDEVHNRDWHEAPAETANRGEGVLAGTMPAATAEAPTASPTETPRYDTVNTTNPAAIPGGTATPTPSTWVGPQDVMGKTLVDADGREIGNINNVGANYFEVPTGLLNLGPTLYVPFTAISHCTANRCYLNLPSGQIERQGWNQRPTEGMVGRGAAPGTPMSSPSPVTATEDTLPTNAGAMTGATMNAGVEQPFRIPVYSEDFDVRRRREEVGAVEITKRVVEEQRTIDVPVSHQEVVVERRPADRDVPVGENAFAEGQREIRVPVYEERVEVEKRPFVREEVVVQPETVTQERQFTETLRREVVDVERQGDVGVTSSGPGASAGPATSWKEAMPYYQQEWQRRYGNTPSASWANVEPAYQFGYENYNSPQFQGQSFDQAEPTLRQQWQQTHPNSPWDRVKNDVRNAWHGVTGH
jgi:uncharacterized protein (TIGR02271 family)